MTTPMATWIASISIMVPVFLISLSVHEFSHAIAATFLGDSTPRKQGRLTLNPLAHIDLLGLLFLILVRIGWAKPVIFDARNFKHPKTYSLLTAFIGPLSNFVMALASMYTLKLLPTVILPIAVNKTFTQIFQAMVGINIMLGVFNLLPIPPLDGGHLLMVFLNEYAPEAAEWVYRYSFFILLAFLLLPFAGSIILSKLFLIAHALLTSLVII
ncbi:site-2 protease family protein [Candidatus Dependentiae bacterium]|nr:site-2 protease family protein [Candidatus Dependentiae bacterium]